MDTIVIPDIELEAFCRACSEWGRYPTEVQGLADFDSLVARHMIDVQREASEMTAEETPVGELVYRDLGGEG